LKQAEKLAAKAEKLKQKLNGAKANGVKVNGVKTNGVKLNGKPMNGHGGRPPRVMRRRPNPGFLRRQRSRATQRWLKPGPVGLHECRLVQ
jgi:hypothetical protein